MMMTKGQIGINEQIALLIEYGQDKDGKSYSLSNVAKITGIRYQTLSNLIKKSSSNPRLETLRSLCKLYDISLDYFACETESACLDMIKAHIAKHSSDIREINYETKHLSPKGIRNVMAIMEWMRRASQDS